MKCPKCDHVSDKVLLECSSCGEAFDRETLESHRHLEFLLDWLEKQVEVGAISSNVHSMLKEKASNQLQDIREALHLLEEEPVPSPPVVVRSIEDISHEYYLKLAIVNQLYTWSLEGDLSAVATNHLYRHLRTELDALIQEGGEEMEVITPSIEEMIEFAFASLSTWSENIPEFSKHADAFQEYFEWKLVKLSEPEPLPVEAPEKVEAPEAEPIEEEAEPAKAVEPEPVVPVKKAALPVQRVEPKPKAPPIDWTKIWQKFVDAFVSGAVLRGLLYLGAFMIVISATILVVLFWNAFPQFLQLVFIALVPTIFYLAGWGVRSRLKLPQAGGVLTGIGALLVAVDFAAVYQFGGLAELIDVNIYWLIASIFSSIVYSLTVWRLPTEFFGYVTLTGLLSSFLALTSVLQLPLEWRIFTTVLAAVVTLTGAVRTERGDNKWPDVTKAMKRFPQILLPISLLAALFVPGNAALGQAAAFLLGTIGYGILAAYYPSAIFCFNGILCSYGVIGFGIQFSALPVEWYGVVGAVLASPYVLFAQRINRQLEKDFRHKKAYVQAFYVTGFGLQAAAGIAGFVTLFFELWTGVIALLLVSISLSVWAYLLRRSILVFAASASFVIPFSFAGYQWLTDFEATQLFAWLMTAWACLALIYILIALTLRSRPNYAQWLYLVAHLMTPVALFVLLINYTAGSQAWFPEPTMAALGVIILPFLASAIIHDSDKHAGLSNFVKWLPKVISNTAFLWPIGFLIPLWLAISWQTTNIAFTWLGLAFAVLGIVYIGAGQLLAKRKSYYRIPFHAYAYLLAVTAIFVALIEDLPFTITLYVVVLIFISQAWIYRRVIDIVIAALLFIWPFQLTLELTSLQGHVSAFAYALLANLVYLSIGVALDKVKRNLAMPVFVTGYALSAVAVFMSIIGDFGIYPENIRWVAVFTPLVVAGGLGYSLYYFNHPLFAWLTTALFALALGQTLALLNVSPAYVPTCWVVFAIGYLLLSYLLTRLQVDENTWYLQFRLPLIVGTPFLGCIGALLTANQTIQAFMGVALDAHFPTILAQVLVVALTILATRLYRSSKLMLLEPWLAFFPVTMFFIGYAEQTLGAQLRPTQFGIVWSGLGIVHLLAAVLLDRDKIRYSHGLYIGGYGLLVFALLWTIGDAGAIVWVLGVTLLSSIASAILTHFNRHQSLDDLVRKYFINLTIKARSSIRSVFVWIAAWLFPIWCVIFFHVIKANPGFQWAGLSGASVLLLILAVWLRRYQKTYAWPLISSAQVYTAVGLFISVPFTIRFLGDGYDLPAARTIASGYILLQTFAVIFYAASAWAHRKRGFTHLAAWLSFFPYTLAWLAFNPILPTSRFAWVWLGWAMFLLVVGYALDRNKIRYSHGPYVVGYLLAGFALFWSIPDRLANLYALTAVIIIGIVSQILVHTKRHQTFEDFLNIIKKRISSTALRIWQNIYLFISVYIIPIALMQLLTYHDVPLAWRGLACALTAPVYVACGLGLRRLRREYTWPLYSAGYALTAIGTMIAFDDQLIAIYVLGLNTIVYAVSAYIFRQSFWLYLSGVLVPVIALITLHYNDLFDSPWVAAILMGIAFVYFGVGWLFQYRRRADQSGLSTYGTPFFSIGYILSAVALAVSSSERMLALIIFSAGVLLYALSAWAFKETVFLYPTAWLAAVPYYLGMTLTPLPSPWYGLGWIPLIVLYIVLGRFVFRERITMEEGSRSLLASLSKASTPFYLLAYGLSISMIVVSQPDPFIFTIAFASASVIYFGSSALFKRPTWLFPGLLTAHLGILSYYMIPPTSGSPSYYISLPFMVVTWSVALIGYFFSRRFPVAAATEEHTREINILGRKLEYKRAPIAGYLTSPSWAQPFFIFAVLDVVIWQGVALSSYETAIFLAVGFSVLIGLFALLWHDRALPFYALAFLLLATGYRFNWAGLSMATAFAWLAGFGFGSYLVTLIIERIVSGEHAKFDRLYLWVRPLNVTAISLTALGVLCTLPVVLTQSLTTAISSAFAGALYLTIAYRGRYHQLGYLGMAMLQFAWIILLIIRDVTQPQFYAIPAGLYFTGMGFLERRRRGGLFALLIEGFGLAVLLVTSFVQSLNGAEGFPYFVLLLFEGLVVAWWGSFNRLRIPFFIGIGSSVINVIAQIILLVNVYDINRWIVILGVGVTLTTAAVLVERKRERLIEQAKEWRETIEKWE